MLSRSMVLLVAAPLLLSAVILNRATAKGEGGKGGEGLKAASGEERVVVVRIINVSFEPREVTVEPGTTIRWVNLDPGVDHDVTSGRAVSGRKTRKLKQTRFPDGKFHSGLFGKGRTFEVTLDERGEYPYFCTIHPVMTGKVVVR